MKYVLFLFLLGPYLLLNAQERFSDEELNDSRQNGKQLERSISKREIFEYKKGNQKNVFHLENGLRSSRYINANEWLELKDTVQTLKVSIIFSKYPVRKHGYKMNHKLLFNRLKNLFAIDDLLNDKAIEYEIVLQTNCLNDDQVDGLYHGIAIQYQLDTAEIEVPIDTTIKNSISIPNPQSAAELLDKVENFNDLPESIKDDLKEADEITKTEILVDYFEQITEEEEEKLDEVDAKFLKKKRLLINRFIKTYGNSNDSIVYKVFDRNPQWNDALVVADWTGSMYQYGAQALLWHTLNFEKSGLSYFTLFNDGDKKRDKKVGSTGGIYFEKADQIKKVLGLYQLVMLRGSGGDSEENDLEAIVKGIEKYPVHADVILIADNNACVRDMSLLELIDEPIKVILCGVNKSNGINPQYLEIAKKTNGSLYTIDQDIYNLEVELNKKGEPINFLDYDLKIGLPPCFQKDEFFSEFYFRDKVTKSLDSVGDQKNYIVNLDLSNQALKKAPRQLKTFKQLKTLNLENNQISSIGRRIYTLKIIELNLSKNQITEVPFRFGKLENLQRLNLSSNLIDTFPSFTYPNLKHLRFLDLSENNISNLNKRLEYRYLEFLYLDNNNLNSLPSSISRLRKLKVLTLSNNNIDELPRKIGYLKKLEVLDLSNNNLTELPKSIIKLKRLKRLLISGNPLKSKNIDQLREFLPNTIIEFQE